jgi:glycosyltransferase involved in cell wall biosynthesis
METKKKIYNGGYLMKKLMVICAPVSSRSGYGEHARDLVRSFVEHDKYDVRVWDVPWGSCPRNALDKNNVNDKKILDCIMTSTELPKKPDIYVDIRIPNEFQQHGNFNIGITAGVETTAVSGKWIEACNKMDLVIVPSEHSKRGFIDSIYDKLQQLPNGQQQKIGDLRLEKPMEVLFEGTDEDIYKPLDTKEIDSEFFDWLNDEVPEKFAYLMVGQWTNGGYGEDRKDIAKLVKVFYESFANKKKKPALILKTSGATYSIMDREDCLKKINQVKSQFPSDWKLPNVYLLHGDLGKQEMNYLYNHPKVKAMVSMTHGEGFGRPLLEATMTGLPVIASGWSGQLDFLDDENCMLIPGKLDNIPKSAVWENILIPESQWFICDEGAMYKALNYTYLNFEEFKSKAKNLLNKNVKRFTLNKMSEKLDEIMKKYLKDTPQQVGLKLPKLKKADDGKLKLPKLKKLTEESK